MCSGLVSVIVPVYGTEEYLSSCIDSICKQSYQNLQIILVDDQSPDKCPEICDRYAQIDERILVIHQNNKGVSGARNTGIRNATGDYIMFVDSDDELYTNAIEILLSDAYMYKADIVSASKSIVAVDGCSRCLYDDNEIRIFEGTEMLEKSLKYERTTRSLHSKLFTKDIIHDLLFAEGHNINEDGYFMFECYAKLPKVIQHNVSVYKYFYRENSASRSVFSEKYFDMLYFCDLKMKYISEKYPFFIEYAKDMEVRTHLLFLDVLCRNADSKYKSIAKKSIEIVRKRFLRFHSISKHEKLMMFIVVLGLYPLYKVLYRKKYYKLKA